MDRHTDSGVFLSKFDPGGDLLWARTWNWNEGAQIAVDSSGNIYLSGIFSGPVDFDPGPGVVNHTGNDSPFLCKVDSDSNFLWVQNLGGVFMGLNTCVAIDQNSDAFVGGTFSNFVDLNPDSTSDIPVSNGKEDIILSKIDSSGNLLWKKTWGGPYHDFCLGVAVDNNGNVYATGYFSGIVDFDPGPSSDEHRSSGPGVYLSKFDPSGNYLWARTWGGAGWDKGNGIAFDGRRNIYVTGEFCGRVDFNPGSGEDWHESTSYNDIFLSKFDLNGLFIWARTWGGENPITGT
jgi:hypothetical protein